MRASKKENGTKNSLLDNQKTHYFASFADGSKF